MTHLSASAAAAGRAASARARPRPAAASSPPPSFSSAPSRTRPRASTPRSCAPRWKPPSAPPTPPAPGTGRRPMTPARRRRSCSCANTARRFSAKPHLRPPRCPLLAKIAGASADPHAPLGGERRPSSSSRRRSRSASPPLTAAAITPGRSRAGAFGRHRPARHPRRDRRRHRSSSTNWPRPAPACSPASFPAIAVTRFDAAQIDDHLDAGVVPTVVLMNPPFSAMANVAGRMADAAYRHVASALARLADGGRLVAITGAELRARRSGLARRLRPACRSAAASCSPPRSTARSMPSTARPSTRG